MLLLALINESFRSLWLGKSFQPVAKAELGPPTRTMAPTATGNSDETFLRAGNIKGTS
jgi:hypothetical protein